MQETFSIKEGLLTIASDSSEIIIFYNISDEEKNDIRTTFGIDEHSLSSCLDVEEVPRIEIDDDEMNFCYSENTYIIFINKISTIYCKDNWYIYSKVKR